jgi:DNA-binding MarR family transcriptional regulator
MASLDRKAASLRDLVQDILSQFRFVDATAADGGHAALSMQELRLVEFLGDKGPRKMSELAEHLLLAVNSVTSTVDNLEAKGIVRRQRSEEDRRIVRVELTEGGQSVYRGAVEEKQLFLRTMLEALTPDEQEIFMVLFRKIARAGRSQVQKMPRPAKPPRPA